MLELERSLFFGNDVAGEYKKGGLGMAVLGSLEARDLWYLYRVYVLCRLWHFVFDRHLRLSCKAAGADSRPGTFSTLGFLKSFYRVLSHRYLRRKKCFVGLPR